MPHAVVARRPICQTCHRASTRTASAAPALLAYTGPELRARDLSPRGWDGTLGCLGCGEPAAQYRYGRCAPCAVAAVFDHFTPDQRAREALAPLRHAMTTSPRPWTALRLLVSAPELFIALGTGTIPIDHRSLDGLPRSRTVEFIRGQLVATGCLPERNIYAAEFESWLRTYLAGLADVSHERVLRQYGTWRILPRIRMPRDRRRQTNATVTYAKTRIQTAAKFMTWLADEGSTLETANQHHVDEFLTLNPQLAGTLQPFLQWAAKTRLSAPLVCQKPPNQPGATITAQERWDLLRKFLWDETIPMADRAMGSLIVAYGLAVTTVLRIQTDDVIVDAYELAPEPEVRVRLDSVELTLIADIGGLVLAHLQGLSLLRQSEPLVRGPWLFPGVRAGRPLSASQAKHRLRTLGLHAAPARASP